MPAPTPTPILRLVHVTNLVGCLRRGGLYAPNHAPKDNFAYRTIHDVGCQEKRNQRAVPCGPRGVIHDYVPFYFGCLSPMLLRLKSGRVDGYTEGQGPLVYLVSTVQAARDAGTRFVFTDGHGLATFTEWFDDLSKLDEVDWTMVNERYWRDTLEDPDRQRRKQAEFLIHRFCEWGLIQKIVVIDAAARRKVEQVFEEVLPALRKPVEVRSDWYYY